MDWHHGRMSSRRLLVLIRHAPEIGPYKTALRDGDWPESTAILAAIHEELALHRAGLYAGGPNEYKPKTFLRPPDRAEVFEAAVADEEFADEAREALFDNLFGF